MRMRNLESTGARIACPVFDLSEPSNSVTPYRISCPSCHQSVTESVSQSVRHVLHAAAGGTCSGPHAALLLA